MNKTEIPEFRLIGIKLEKKTTNDNMQSAVDCGNLWQKFVTGNYAGNIPGKLGDEIYAVYFDYEGDHTRPFSYFIGCKVMADSVPPQNMCSLLIPAGNFAKVTAKGKMPECIANAWIEIWKSKIDRAYVFDFELYGEHSRDMSNAEVEIFISTHI